MTGRQNRPPMERFEEKFIPEPMSGCWLWISAGFAQGYGSFTYEGRNIGAHRASWELHVGTIPDAPTPAPQERSPVERCHS